MKNILLIGGTGFIGRHLIEVLNKNNHQLILFSRQAPSFDLPPGVISIQGDRMQLKQYRQQFEMFKPDVVVDLIPYTQQEAENLLETFQGITPHIVALSSGDVYQAYEIFHGYEAPVVTDELNENSALRTNLFPYRRPGQFNDWLYDYEKIHVEQVLMGNGAIDITILRLAALYGEYDSQKKLSAYIQPMLKGEDEILIPEHKANWRWTRAYVKDIIQAIELSIEQEAARNEIFNVGAKKTYSQFEIIELLKAITGWKGNIVTIKQNIISDMPDDFEEELTKDEYNYGQHIVLNSQKIRDMLGYKETYPYIVGLDRTIAYEKSLEREN
ncbi:hypothetical protein BKI52_28450 [marine bacterium AO1-C]|nr:hypothetical protein BKI52_28450 [marine bacterium AO1-C]